MTIIVLAGVVGRSIPPGGGRPAVRARGGDLTSDDDAAGLTSARGRARSSTSRRAAARSRSSTTRPRSSSCVGARHRHGRARRRSPYRPSFGVFEYLLRQGYEVRAGEPDRDVGPWRGGRSVAGRGGGRGDRPDRHRRRLPPPRGVPGVAAEAVAVRARALWLQLGVVNWEAARIAAAAGSASSWTAARRSSTAGCGWSGAAAPIVRGSVSGSRTPRARARSRRSRSRRRSGPGAAGSASRPTRRSSTCRAPPPRQRS